MWIYGKNLIRAHMFLRSGWYLRLDAPAVYVAVCLPEDCPSRTGLWERTKLFMS